MARLPLSWLLFLPMVPLEQQLKKRRRNKFDGEQNEQTGQSIDFKRQPCCSCILIYYLKILFEMALP